MKILLITDLYPVKQEEKTTPRTLCDFVEEWIKMGHTVKIIKPNFILNSFIRKKPFYKTGWYEDVFNVNYWLPFLGNIKNKLKKYYEKDFQPDVVIAHMPSGILFADKLELPFSAGIHCSDITVMTNPIYMLFKYRMIKALDNAKKIFCRSYVLETKLTSLFPKYKDKTFAAPSGVDEKFILDSLTHNIDTEHLKIITCANFKKRKNIDKIIQALKYFDNIELTVIGDGKDKNKLKQLDKRTIFTGRLEHEKVLELMRQSDIFILPSVNETFGMVYLEAMASGCITICTENEAIDGIIKFGENGFTVKPDWDYISDLICHIALDIDENSLNQIRKNALDTAKNYTKKSCAENYLKMLTDT